MKKPRVLALAMAILMLAAALASCGDVSDTADDTSNAASTTAGETAAETVAETTDSSYFSDLSGLDYGGKEIRLLVDNYKYSTDEFYAETINGALVNDAVYQRNQAVEKALNVKLTITRVETTSDTAVLTEMERSITAGDNLYDIVTIPGYRAASGNYGYYKNLKTVDNLNLDKLYWTQGFNQIMGNSTTQYLASGAYSISMIRGMYVTIFNKDLLSARNLTSPYELVNSNNWTIDKQIELIKGTYNDLNGNNTADAEDFYGFAGGCYTTSDPYWVSWNCSFLSMNNEGQYELNVDSDKFVSIIEKYHDFIINNTDVYCVATGVRDANGVLTTEAIADMFTNEKAMMVSIELCLVEKNIVPSFSGNYGIVPLPKYNSDQEEFYTHTSDRLTCMAIVSTVPDEDLPIMGAVMETIAYESYKTVFPAYYEVALSTRFLQDSTAKSMIDLMYNGIKLEGAFLYSKTFNMLGGFRTLFASGEAAATTLAANMKSWKASLKSLNKNFAQ